MTKKIFASILFSCVAVFAFTLTSVAQDEAVAVAEDEPVLVEGEDAVFPCGPAVSVDDCDCGPVQVVKPCGFVRYRGCNPFKAFRPPCFPKGGFFFYQCRPVHCGFTSCCF